MLKVRCLSWLLCALVALPVLAHAEKNAERNGFFAGIGYGGSWAKVKYGDDQKSEWSGTLALRAGWALQQDLLLGGEYVRWAKGYSIATLQGDIPYDVTLESALAVVTYFPGNGGFVMRGGLGAAFADIESGAAPAYGIEATSVSADPGLAVLAGAGYETRLTERFALGVDFDVLYLGASGDGLDRAYLYGLNVELNWYW